MAIITTTVVLASVTAIISTIANSKITKGIFISSGVIFVILSILPPSIIFPGNYPLPTQIGTAFDWLFSTLWTFDFIIPVSTLTTGLFYVIMTDLTFLLFKFILFIWSIFNKA